MTAALYQFDLHKYIMLGLRKGIIKTYELETGRPDGSYPAYSETTDIIEMMTTPKYPVFFTTEESGLITMWISPPS